ncbi:hypothetical protein [Aeromicrobium sp.]
MAIDRATPAEGPDDDGEHLLIDELSERLDTLRLFTVKDEARANVVLEKFGSQGPVEDQMLLELSSKTPLRHPDRFEEAHRGAMRAIEVFDRNGARPPGNLRIIKPLRRPAARAVQILIRIVVRLHQKRLIRDMRTLYALREANCPVGTPEHQMLSTARTQMDGIIPDLSRNTTGLPAFLLGGALISGTVSLIQRGMKDEWGRLAIGVLFIIIAVASFWCVLRAAALARRRTRIALDASLKALWETIGDAGSPPRDQSRLFATIAAILLVLVWIVLPVLIALIVAVTRN